MIDSRRSKGKVEGRSVDDIGLDTGCACTMVRHDLVPEDWGHHSFEMCSWGRYHIPTAVIHYCSRSQELGTDVPELINQPAQPQAYWP